MTASSSFEEQPWLNRAVEAARLVAVKDKDEELGTQLLRDLRIVFGEQGTDRLFSARIVDALVEMEDHPRSEYGKHRKPLTERQLVILLKQYDVTSKTLRSEGRLCKGNLYSELQPALNRYTVTKQDISIQDREMSLYASVTDSENVTDRNVTGNTTVTLQKELVSIPDRKIHKPVTDVTDKSGGPEGTNIGTSLLASQGYAPIQSDVLDGETIVIVRDPKNIPERYRSYVA
jgi:DNA-binding transcriptional regulator of glucitol operon